MKKIYSTLGIILLIVFSTSAQNAILNGNFENWNPATFTYPVNCLYTSEAENISLFLQNSIPFNQTVTKTTDAYQGSYALKLTTKLLGGNTILAYCLNAQPGDKAPTEWHGGAPYTEMPTGLSGYYKYNLQTGDSALILISFSKAGSNIGFYAYKLGGTQSSYIPFSYTFTPALTQAPDSVLIGFASSDAFNNVAMNGSTLTVDNVMFTGVASQPAQYKGDYETWTTSTYYAPASWLIERNGGKALQGISRTTDAHTGTYAIELKTYLGDSNNHPAARPGRISTGYYLDNCNSNCVEQGGQPFSSIKDTLTFYYKYTPSGADSAMINLSFKKNGTFFANEGRPLLASSSYSYMQIPIDLYQTPDSVIIDIQSSTWADSITSFVGSDLIIDDIQFKSQPLAVFNAKNNAKFQIMPNPVTSTFQVVGIDGVKAVSVINSDGKIVLSKDMDLNEPISVSSLPSGIYIVQIKTSSGVIEQKLVKK